MHYVENTNHAYDFANKRLMIPSARLGDTILNLVYISACISCDR